MLNYYSELLLRTLSFYTCLSFCPGGVVSQHALQVSRPTPRGEVEGSGQGGLQAYTQGESWGVWPGGGLQAHTQWGSPGSHLGGLQAHTQGVSRPTPWGGVYPSMCWGRPPPHRLLLWAVCILLECILVRVKVSFIVSCGIIETLFTLH